MRSAGNLNLKQIYKTFSFKNNNNNNNMNSQTWVKDIYDMHTKFGVNKAIEKLTPEQLNEFLNFRIKFLEEELNETKKAAKEKDAEEVVDGLIDLCVVAIGTLDAFGVNAYAAWSEVHNANMTKKVGIKESRPNKMGLPDLIKPTKETHGYDWQPPSHEGNHGKLNEL